MFSKTTIKKSVLLVVALLMCAILLFAACNPDNQFVPVELPEEGEVVGNGSAAVRYGNWIYYVNGYQSSSSANNDYTSEIRTAAIVRIKVKDLDDIIAINKQDISSSKKTEAIKEAVSKNVQLVIPNFYYTGNTSDASLNGIHIYNGRIYITTPNSKLDANGNILNEQLVLASYKLDGSDRQDHYVFTESNAPQLKLACVDKKVIGMYVLSNGIYSLDVAAGESKQIVADTSSQRFSGENIYFLDKEGSVCQYKLGASEHSVLVANTPEEGHEGHNHGNPYTITSANGAYVYYTNSNSKTSGKELYYATLNSENKPVTDVALATIPDGSYYGWGTGVVYTASVSDSVPVLYGIYTAFGSGNVQIVLDPAKNDSSITFNKLEGNILYYSAASVSYTLDLSVAGAKPVPYAYSLSTSATGWSLPSVLGEYVITLGTNSVTAVKFNKSALNNNISGTTISSSVTITLLAPVEEEAE